MSLSLTPLLIVQAKADASDLHLVTGEPPHLRLKSAKLEPIPDTKPMTKSDIEKILLDLTDEKELKKFQEEKEYELGFEEKGLGRFRATFYEDSHGPAVAFRRIPFEIPTPEALDISPEILNLIEHQDGLILVTGPNGHGKTTTLASLIEHINQNRQAHIVTIEDPIEFVFTNKKSIISQRAVGVNTRSFASAVKHTIRQDVDVIVIGEMRDLETIATALTLAETGHLVLATLHTHDAPRAVQRIVDVFPAEQQAQVALQLSHSLTAVMSQRLIPMKDGRQRACAREIMIANDGIRHAIRTHKLSEIYAQIQISREAGMQTFDDSLYNLVKSGKIDSEEALRHAHDMKQLKVRLKK